MLKDCLAETHVLLDMRTSSKSRLLEDLALHAGALLRMPMQPILAALEKREALGSTGMGNGFALPHAEIAGLTEFFGLFARLNRPMDFDAVDRRPIDLVFVLLIPEGRAQDRIKILASICRLFRDGNFVAALRSAKNEKSVLKILCD